MRQDIRKYQKIIAIWAATAMNGGIVWYLTVWQLPNNSLLKCVCQDEDENPKTFLFCSERILWWTNQYCLVVCSSHASLVETNTCVHGFVSVEVLLINRLLVSTFEMELKAITHIVTMSIISATVSLICLNCWVLSCSLTNWGVRMGRTLVAICRAVKPWLLSANIERKISESLTFWLHSLLLGGKNTDECLLFDKQTQAQGRVLLDTILRDYEYANIEITLCAYHTNGFQIKFWFFLAILWHFISHTQTKVEIKCRHIPLSCFKFVLDQFLQNFKYKQTSVTIG